MGRVEVPRDLKQRYNEGRLIPFVGAGASMSVTWDDGMKRGRSWTELVDQAARILGFARPELLRERASALQILEYYRLKKHDEMAELLSWFEREMNPPDEALLESRVFSGLARLSRCPLIYTTNYDDFIERTFGLMNRPYVSVATEAHVSSAIRTTTSTKVDLTQIVKFHGDLKNPRRMVMSEDDYDRRMTFADFEDQRLKADLLGRALLFVGYSFSDYNVSYLFRLVNETHGRLPESGTGRRAYIILPAPSDFEYTLFQNRNIEVIPISGIDRAAEIGQILDGLAS
jgi:hypothetical protein